MTRRGAGVTSWQSRGPQRELRVNDPTVTYLYHHLREHQISLTQLAVTSGVHLNTIRSWFSGRRSPSLVNLIAVCDTLGLTLTVGPTSCVTVSHLSQLSPSELHTQILSVISSSRLGNRELAVLAATSATALSQRLAGTRPSNAGSPAAAAVKSASSTHG